MLDKRDRELKPEDRVDVVLEPAWRRVVSILRWWGPLIFYMVLIYWLSSRSLPVMVLRAPDYALHFLGYFVMGILTVRAFARGVAVPVAGRLAGYSMFFSLSYALSDEWHQMFVPGRVASFQDILADGLGILASVGFLFLFWRLRARLSNRTSAYASLETR